MEPKFKLHQKVSIYENNVHFIDNKTIQEKKFKTSGTIVKISYTENTVEYNILNTKSNNLYLDINEYFVESEVIK